MMTTRIDGLAPKWKMGIEIRRRAGVDRIPVAQVPQWVDGRKILCFCTVAGQRPDLTAETREDLLAAVRSKQAGTGAEDVIWLGEQRAPDPGLAEILKRRERIAAEIKAEQARVDEALKPWIAWQEAHGPDVAHVNPHRFDAAAALGCDPAAVPAVMGVRGDWMR